MRQKTIVCYGDSNTWGYLPLASLADSSPIKARYSRHQRWTGILQALLGEEYYVVEEGLNSRTTNLDYSVPPDRNGKTYLAPCLYSQAPIDLVVLSLGANDTKTYFNRDAQQITAGLAELIDIIQGSGYGPNMQGAPKVLILSQVIPLSFVENTLDEQGALFFAGIVEKTKQLVALYAQLAIEKKCDFLDVSQKVLPSEIDGVHYDLQANKILADLLNEKIRQIFSEQYENEMKCENEIKRAK